MRALDVSAYTADDDAQEQDIAEQPGRLIAHRMFRVWQLIEHIAANPGKHRKEMALEQSLSERQMQADLNMLSRSMGVPLERRNGYRIHSDPNQQVPILSQAQVLLLVELLVRSYDKRAKGLLESVVQMLPRHLQPLAELAARSVGHELFDNITDALYRGRYLRLEFIPNLRQRQGVPSRPLVKPEVLVPYCEHWYMLGRCAERGNDVVIVPLEELKSATPEQPGES